ncbi:serine/threonine-protein phosphatase 4 regulatory subunit 3-B-like [Hydractinia symbiolongicarpus]|uniref:serine/threonine-protein phosphatase 4 regulatory subunit 3-B-like n=1 Tax=Hydractinia symbiolongicarpus TaxID=13093 RepID=UPI002550193B|nr:serine/threonine-protein phosphatase 4 regulatory subunit 3-B-like [Hydractinia symbiolongicarpus]
MSNTRRRVKLYVLNERRQWDDHGTGYVSTLFMDHDSQNKGIVLLVRSDEDGKVMLESRIQTDTVYQRQQDTLVVWTEADNDLALSFQEKEGCGEIWEKICQVQGTNPENAITQDVIEEDANSYEDVQDLSVPIELPPCDLSKLDEISELFYNALASPVGREKLAMAIEHDGYVKKLIDLFHMCEDLENTEGLHTLFEIFKSLFMLEKNSLFEVMFLPENIMDIVGILEYDPSKKETTPHRQFLNDTAKFKEVIPISNTELLNKIHQTYRVQYIKDILVPIPSFFDENMSTLGSFLFFNKIEIVRMIQEDPNFLEELFAKLTDDEISDEKRKETLFLLKELCLFSHSLQQPNRDTFIKNIADHGLLQSLEQLMNLDEVEIRSAIVDIICSVVEFNPSLVREYLSKEADFTDEDSMLLNTLIDMLLMGAEDGTGVIILQLIRNLLDPENMGLGNNKMEKSDFLAYFYHHCVHVLTAPIFAVTATKELSGKDDFKRATILGHIVEILTFCVEHHSHHIRTHIITKDLLRRVLILMQSKHKFLALAALRFCRRVIGMKDELLNRYIVVNKLLQPVVNAFLSNGKRYNLLNSAIIELFEFIRLEDIKSLCAYVVENHISAFENTTYVDTFSGLKTRYEQEKDRLKKNDCESKEEQSVGIIYVNNTTRKRRDDRVLDEYEENWFDTEDDEVVNSTNELESTSTKPLSAKLKDVDLIDNLDSPPTSQNSRRPDSPESVFHLQNSERPNSPNSVATQNTTTKVDSSYINNAFQNNVRRLTCAKPLNNTKPTMNIKINSNFNLKSKGGTHSNNLANHTNNGISNASNVNASQKTIITTTKETPNIAVKTKSLLTSLVDYPDDDDDSADDDEVPSSPAKKQRIGSS